MSTFFAVVVLVYGVMALHRAMTFQLHENARYGHYGYPLLLASACLLDILVFHQLREGAGWNALAAIPGLGFATLGLAILSVKSWKAQRRDPDRNRAFARERRYAGTICVLVALLLGFVVTPYAQSIITAHVAGTIALGAVVVGGLLLVAIIAFASQKRDSSREKVYRSMGCITAAAIAFVAVSLFRLGPSPGAPGHLIEAALIFALLVIAGLGATWSDGRLR